MIMKMMNFHRMEAIVFLFLSTYVSATRSLHPLPPLTTIVIKSYPFNLASPTLPFISFHKGQIASRVSVWGFGLTYVLRADMDDII